MALDRAQGLAAQAGVDGAVTWIEADLVEYQPPPAAFDLILLLFVHPHADERARLLVRAVDALASGGTILVVGYDTANATEGDGGVRDPTLLFSPHDIARELPGLRVERAEQLRVGQAVDAIVRATKPDAG